ncbi:MAG: mechanosensitive ion channel family protein [Rhodoglobus sp.]
MFDWQTWIALGVALAIAAVAVVVLSGVAALAMRLVARRHPGVYDALGATRRRLRVALAIVGAWAAVVIALPPSEALTVINHVFSVATIAAAGWLLGALLNLAMERTLRYYPIDVADNRVARRVRTQVLILRRLGHAVIAILTIAAVLLTFPGAQTLGASILASAGLVSVVAGIAAQSTLANVFAGMQLAFSDAIRVDDVVIAEGEWGRIEEITLTYVVVGIWDQRRLVLPSTYFTTTPFQNWTRQGSELLGAVELDVDWSVSPSELRKELDKVLARTSLWDERTSNVQITDATGGFVRVRVLVSAADAGTLWDLRCFVREQLVEWLASSPDPVLPRQRVRVLSEEPPTTGRKRRSSAESSGLFSGSPDAEERGQQFTGAVPVQHQEEPPSTP